MNFFQEGRVEGPKAGQVWCVTPSASGGWAPVNTLATLLARLWGTNARFLHPTVDYSRPRRALAMLPRRRGDQGSLLAIVAHPGDMLALGEMSTLLHGFTSIGVWVIDSFWDERIPRFARMNRNIDRVWITDAELVDRYASVMKVPCGWAPWGTDALGQVPDPVREIDVLRLGRQPAAWDDDASNRAALTARGLSYQGRFPEVAGSSDNQQEVLRQLSRAKVVLASSNLSSPGPYTHPSRDYVTARFTDAVAMGTIIAGTFPRCKAAEMIPLMGRAEVDVTSQKAGLEAMAHAVDRWTPELAKQLHHVALEELDWRHRIAMLSAELGVSHPTLRAELGLLAQALCRTSTAAGVAELPADGMTPC